MSKLLEKLGTHFPRAGKLEWIGVRPESRGEMTVVDEVQAKVNAGLVGDRATRRPGGKRQVTLIQAEHLPAIADLCGRVDIDPTLLRRNLVVSGINLRALNGKRFRIGDVLLEVTDFCDPCQRMEEVLGEGGYNAMCGHGGMTAIIREGGVVQVGNEVVAI